MSTKQYIDKLDLVDKKVEERTETLAKASVDLATNVKLLQDMLFSQTKLINKLDEKIKMLENSLKLSIGFTIAAFCCIIILAIRVIIGG